MDESKIQKIKKRFTSVCRCLFLLGVCFCYRCEFLIFFLSEVVFDDKFNIKLTVTNRDCSDNLQETLQQLQSKVSKRNEGDLQQLIEEKSRQN